jgi:Cobalt transport protein
VKVDPRLRVLYVIAVAVGIFLVKPLWGVAALLGAQCVLWLAVGLPPRRLVRQIFKLWGFALLLVASYLLTGSDDGEPVQWIRWHFLKINPAGALVALKMILRIATIVVASQVAKAGDPRAIAAGLDKLFVPKIVAVSIDAVLALFGGGRGGGGGGGGGGGTGGPQFSSVTLSGGQLTLSWTTGTLASGPTINGTFTPVAGATSPFKVAPTGTATFYILKP